jgi:hypothetical protein
VNWSGVVSQNLTSLNIIVNITNNNVSFTSFGDQTLEVGECFGGYIPTFDNDSDLIYYTLDGIGELLYDQIIINSSNETIGGIPSYNPNYYAYCSNVSSDVGDYSITIYADDAYGSNVSDTFNISVINASTIKGVVYESDIEDRVDNATVFLMNSNHTLINLTTTNINGYYEFPYDELANGSYYIWAVTSSSQNYTNFSIPIDTSSIEIQLYSTVNTTTNHAIGVDYTGSVGDTLTHTTSDSTYCLDYLLGIGNCTFPSADTYEVIFTATDENGFTGNQSVTFTTTLTAGIRKFIVMWIN